MFVYTCALENSEVTGSDFDWLLLKIEWTEYYGCNDTLFLRYDTYRDTGLRYNYFRYDTIQQDTKKGEQ